MLACQRETERILDYAVITIVKFVIRTPPRDVPGIDEMVVLALSGGNQAEK